MRRRWPKTVPGVANARAKAERRGRNPAAKGSPGRRVSDATSVIVLLIFLPRPRADRVLRGGGVYPTGPVLARTAKSAFSVAYSHLKGPAGSPDLPVREGPIGVPGHSLLGGWFYEPYVDVQLAFAAGFRPARAHARSPGEERRGLPSV